MSFSEIRMTGGTVTIRDEARNISERVTDIDMSLAWPAISKSFAATGRAIWRDEAVDIGVTFSDFAATLRGDRTGLKVRLAGAPMKFAFDGTMSVRPTLKVDGALSADTLSLRRVAAWTGQKALPGGGFERFSLKAQTNVVGGTIALTSANLELDGNPAEGVLTFATDGRQTLQGTLAADSIDLTPYLSSIRLLTDSEREWNRVPISLDGLAGLELDLRLSAAKVSASGTKLGRTAIAANLRGGKLTLTVGESRAFGGVIKGSVGFATAEQGVEFKSQLQFTDIDLDSTMTELFGLKRLEGKGDLCFHARGNGIERACAHAHAQWHRHPHRPAGRVDGTECRTAAAPARAPPAVRRQRISQRTHAVRSALGCAAHHQRHRRGRNRHRSKARR